MAGRQAERATLPISVVIPAYNAAQYLAEAIASVRGQTCLPTEIIVVDDGSSDATSEIAKALGVTLCVQENGGVSRARNNGVRIATAPWIAFLDADDIWEPQKLERQWQALQLAPSSRMCFTGSLYFQGDQALPGGLQTIPEFRRVELMPTVDTHIFVCESRSYARTLAQVNFIVHASILVAREMFIETGGYDETMRYSEDLDWILRAATLTSVVLVNEPLANIRTHESNSSARWDRMILAHVSIGFKAEEHPDRYPPGVASDFARLRPRAYLEAGLCLLRGLHVSEAKQQFLFSRRERPSLAAACLLALATCCETPPGRQLLKMLRNILRRKTR